jgi:hypothetical protein
MGKPFGFGQVAFQVQSSDLRPNDPSRRETTLAECQERFTAFMEERALENSGCAWADTPQMQALLAMADPGASEGFPGRLRHMPVPEDYADAKQERLVLAEYTGTPVPNQITSPRSAGGADAQSGQPAIPNAWLREKVAELMAQHNASETDILRGKPLAEAWQALEEGSEKESVREALEEIWRTHGWWECPQGKSAKKAKRIYTGEEG